MLSEVPHALWPGFIKHLKPFDSSASSVRWIKALKLALPPLLLLFLMGPGLLLLRAELNKPVTLLILGSDNRAHNGPSRSDSIFVIRTDPAKGVIRGLSLPRDLYVPLSGLPILGKSDRLNTALFWGEYYGAKQGLSAARATVSSLTGVPVNGVVLVRFNLVSKMVDALGGVEVYFEKPLADAKFSSLFGDRSYLLRFESGWNYLDGARAMEYIRVRKPDTDFGRMNRNRQLLTRIMGALRSPRKWLGLAAAGPSLWNEIEMQLDVKTAIRLAWAIRRDRSQGIEWNSIRKDQVAPFVTPKGAQVLAADPGALEEAGRALTGEPRYYATLPAGSSAPAMAR